MKKTLLYISILTLSIIQGKMEAQVNNDFKAMIEAATKAPSGHNTQPWLFKVNQSSIEILPNLADTLPVVDKNNRELFISLGAATENLCIMASHLGYYPTVKTDDKAQSITIELGKSSNIQKDDLALQIAKRQTNRNVYDEKVVPKDILSILENQTLHEGIYRYTISKEDSLFSTLKSYVVRGNEIQMNDDAFKDELLRYMRLNNKEVEKNPTGLTYKVMGAPSLPAIISRPIVKSYLKADKQNKSDIRKIESSSHFILFTTENDTFIQWVDLGRSLERYLLKIAELNLAYAFLNQPCEVKLLSDEMQNEVPLIKGQYPTLLLRIGYAPKAPYSPRKNIEDVILK